MTFADTTGTAVTQTGTTAQAGTTTALPTVSVTPDSMFYQLKLLVEKIRMAITIDAVDKATLLEQQAEVRLAEAKVMAEAGKADMAQAALVEAQTKLAAAQAQMKLAAKSNKDLTKLQSMVNLDETQFATVLSGILAKAPVDVQAKVQVMAADLLTQVSANKDTASKDDQAKVDADKVTTDAKLQSELSDLQPRQILVLNAMAKASGKSLADVFAMYQANPGLGRIAQELSLKMGAVQHAAQIEWKVAQKVDAVKPSDDTKKAAVKSELTTEPKTEVESNQKDDKKSEIKISPLGLTLKANGEATSHGKGHGKH
jgi:hypothetical protein